MGQPARAAGWASLPGAVQGRAGGRGAYLLELVRYPHLNPVRARLVEGPEEYARSGHRADLGLETVPWLETGWVLGQFANRVFTAWRRYAAFIAAGVGEGHCDDFHRGARDSRVLAEDSFTEAVLGRSLSFGRTPTLEQIIEDTCQHYDVTVAELVGPSRARHVSEARGVAAWLAFTTKAATLAEVGDRLHRGPTTFSRRVARIEREAKTTRLLSRRLVALQTAVTQS